MTRTDFCRRFDDLFDMSVVLRDRENVTKRVDDQGVSVSYNGLHLASFRYDCDDPETAAYAVARMIDLVNLLS